MALGVAIAGAPGALGVDRPGSRKETAPVSISGHVVDAKPGGAVVEGSIVRCEGTLEWRGVERPRMVMIRLRAERPPTDSPAAAENDGRVTVTHEDAIRRSGTARWRASLSATASAGQDAMFLEVTPLARGYEPYRDARGKPCVWSQRVTIEPRAQNSAKQRAAP